MALVGCSTTPPQSTSWTYTSGAWQSSEGETKQLGSANLLAPLTIRVGMSERAGRALDALIVASEAGMRSFAIGGVAGDVFTVGLPPPPTAARDFAVVHVGPSGMRVSAPGGAEHHVACEPCASASDWSAAGVEDALDHAGSGEVLVSVDPSVPWGAALTAFDACADRTLRIGRER